jgi:hypothetical protein
VAIEQALTILNWYENLEKKDVPPEHLWEDPEGLELWWKKVENRRSDGRSDDDYSSQPAEPEGDEANGHPMPAMAENDLARYLKQQ